MRDASRPSVAWVESGQAQIGWGIAEERVADSTVEAVRLVGELASGAHGSGPWFGGLAFPAEKSGYWSGYPAARFIRPERLEQKAMRGVSAGGAPTVAGPMSPAWRALVDAATDTIARGELEKVVVARAHDVPCGQSAWSVFEALCAVPAARHFWFDFGACFLGASPETLLRWHGGVVEVDALAGSAPPAAAFGEKEQREHDVVVRAVVRALDGLSPQLTASVMELPYVRHLHTRVRAVAGAGLDVAALLQRLFPTPAVAGTQRETAIDFIGRHEGLARGWYTGAVGRVAPGDVDLAVALRCALVDGERARLFAGAGIVAGSDAQAEWDETVRKMAPMLRAIRRAEESAHAERRALRQSSGQATRAVEAGSNPSLPTALAPSENQAPALLSPSKDALRAPLRVNGAEETL